jgi:low affinity Fe/Cu permease
MNTDRVFVRFANRAAQEVGHPIVFAVAVLLIVLWLASGPLFHYSDTWQLVVNTVTTVITFLMVFLIQSTQNRDTAAIHIKLNELIRATAGAQNSLVEVEKLDEKTFSRVQKQFEQLARRARNPTKKDFSDPAFVRAVLAALNSAE